MSKKILTKTIAIANGYTGTVTLLAESDVEVHLIVPAAPCTLGGNVAIALSGTPTKGMRFHFTLSSAITIGANTFTIFGTSIGAKQMASGFDLLLEYNGTAWVPFIRQDFSKTGFIGGDKLASDIVDGSTLEIDSNVLRVKDLGITLAKLQNLGGEAKLLISDATGAPQIVSLSGAVTVDKDGVVTLGALSIDTADINDEAITLDKMADLSQGSMIIGNASARPAAVDCKASGYLLLGNGVTIVPVTLSGDVTIAAGGAVTIAANAITTAKILDGNVTLAKVANIGAGYIIVGNASGIPTAVVLSGDATISSAGAISIGAAKILEAHIADGAITPAKLAIETPVTGFSQGIISSKTVDSTRLKALLDGTTNDLFDINAGEIVLGVNVFVQTAHGAPATCNVGVDASARTAGAVVDGFIKSGDLAVVGVYKSDNATYSGALQKFGFFQADNAGKITINSSTDCSSGALVSGAVMFYIAKGA